MNGNKNVKIVQVYNQNNELILERNKNFFFPTKFVNNNQVNNVLMIKDKELPELYRGAIVDVVLTLKGGDRIKYFCQVDFSSTHQLNITLSPERAKQLEERRRFYKIKTVINCRVIDLTRDGEVNAYNPALYGKIYDINLGGVFVSIDSEEKYKEGDIITFTAILNDYKLEASVRVLRVRMTNNAVSGYGCSFTTVDNHKEAMISSYINYLQIEERRIELEKEKIQKEIEREFNKGSSS
ncbi:MAG: PilZ domain-containing protein [Oscillospiraceae bacterium]|nr:PilZ domain-containing protein [Oscillospiraceae bacterium]